MRAVSAWGWRSGLLASAIVAIVGVAGAPAQATVPPRNVGWLYTTNNAGAVFFDADLAGHSGWEKITVCDNYAPDGAIIEARIDSDANVSQWFQDTSRNGHCTAYAGNFFSDGYAVTVYVYEYSGQSANYFNIGYGVA
jgi:hypothetical protein